MPRKVRIGTLLKGFGGLVGTLATVVATLLALGLIKPFGDDAFARAVDRTIDAGSSRVTMALSLEAPSPAESISFSATGSLDYRTGRGRLTYDYSASGGPSAVDGIVSGTAVYLRLPADVVALPPGKSWVRFGLSELFGEGEGSVQVSTLPLGQNDPSQLLTFLEATGDVEKVGDERLFGEETVHYRGRVDAVKFVEHVRETEGGAGEAAARKLVQSLRGDGIRFEVWVDADDLVRRETIRMIFAQGGETATLEARIDLFDFGVAVAADPPPPAETVDFSELPAPPSGFEPGSSS